MGGAGQYSVMAERSSTRRGYKPKTHYKTLAKQLIETTNNLKFSDSTTPGSTLQRQPKGSAFNRRFGVANATRILMGLQRWRRRTRVRLLREKRDLADIVSDSSSSDASSLTVNSGETELSEGKMICAEPANTLRDRRISSTVESLYSEFESRLPLADDPCAAPAVAT